MKNLLSDLAKTRNDLCLNNVTNTIKEQLPDKQKHILKRILLGESEQKIATSLFNTGPSGRSFQLAKSQLIDQLLYMIPYINGGDKIQKEKLKVYRYLTAVRVFELFGLQSLLVRVANKTLKKCETYHMWYEATHLARLLSTHYAVFDIDIKKAENYNALCINYCHAYQDEIEFRWAYALVRNHFREKGESSDHNFIKEIGDGLQPKLKKNNMRCNFFYYIIRYTEYYTRQDYNQAIKLLHEALDYFNTLSYDHTLAKNFFISNLIKVYLEVNEFDKAEDIINQFLKTSDKVSLQTFKYKELLFRIKIHSQAYQEAEELLQYLNKNKKRFNEPDLKDRMLIYELYINLLKGNNINFRKLRYRFNRLNKEKEELLIPFKIGEIAYMYLYENDKLYDKLDALNQYAYRVLKHKKFKRTALFIKIITQIMTDKPYDLNELTASTEMSNSLIELVNYNHLISFLLEKEQVRQSA